MDKTLFVVAPVGSGELLKSVCADWNEVLERKLREHIKEKIKRRGFGPSMFNRLFPVKINSLGQCYVEKEWRNIFLDHDLLEKRSEEIGQELLDREWERRVFFENQNFLYKWMYRLELFDLFWPFIFQFGRIAW